MMSELVRPAKRKFDALQDRWEQFVCPASAPTQQIVLWDAARATRKNSMHAGSSLHQEHGATPVRSSGLQDLARTASSWQSDHESLTFDPTSSDDSATPAEIGLTLADNSPSFVIAKDDSQQSAIGNVVRPTHPPHAPAAKARHNFMLFGAPIQRPGVTVECLDHPRVCPSYTVCIQLLRTALACVHASMDCVIVHACNRDTFAT